MEKERKMAGDDNQHVICCLLHVLLSLLALLITSFQQQLVVLYNLIFQLQQQQAMVMQLTHSDAVNTQCCSCKTFSFVEKEDQKWAWKIMAKAWKDRRMVGECVHRKITRRRMEK